MELCEGLEKIGRHAFMECKSLKGIKIPSSIKVIEHLAFKWCTQLVGVELCDGLELIVVMHSWDASL